MKWERGEQKGGAWRRRKGKNYLCVRRVLPWWTDVRFHTETPAVYRAGPMVGVSGSHFHTPFPLDSWCSNPSRCSPLRHPPGLKASWDAGPSPWPFNANPWALSFPGTLPGAVESGETVECPRGINDSVWWVWRETMLKSGRPPVSAGRGPGQKLCSEKRKQKMLFNLAFHYVVKEFTEVKACVSW